MFDEKYDVVIVGAGHAGCEAAHAAARMGLSTALYTMNADLIAQMSCNPAIGGIAKGHLVREIDALGGIMGLAGDEAGIQFRLLNTSRGPAVWSPRAQADKAGYRYVMRRMLEHTANLFIKQAEVTEIVFDGNRASGIELLDGRRVYAKAVILTTGTFLNGLIHIGEKRFTAGRNGEPASITLGNSIRNLGFDWGRLKTGTPPRLDRRTINFSMFEPQHGDPEPTPFSFRTTQQLENKICCYITHTDEKIHSIIRANMGRSPLYSGQIKGIGPRYCPSIEDKVVKFQDKPRHQLFLEPEGHDTHEVYLNGFSTSLPSDLQIELVHQIPGLDEAKIIRPGYAIEYDFVDPRELTPFLQTTRVQGLFFAGQINGTTGYEEAACQGLLAGINAALYVQRRQGFRLRREESYIGVLIDDLITQGVDEPYRMFTSRAENRLMLRYDTSDLKLSPYGKKLGLVNDSEWNQFSQRRDRLARLRAILIETRFKRSDSEYDEISRLLERDLGDSISLANLAQFPNINPETLFNYLSSNIKANISLSDLETVVADLLYHGYIRSQYQTNERINHYDNLVLPANLNYSQISGLSREMVERLERAKPFNFGNIRRIPGITAGALSTLLFYLKNFSNSPI